MGFLDLIKSAQEGDFNAFEEAFASLMDEKVDLALSDKFDDMFEEKDMDDDEDEDEDETEDDDDEEEEED